MCLSAPVSSLRRDAPTARLGSASCFKANYRATSTIPMTKVMLFGTFDILHPGHEYLLKNARKYGDYLTAVVARDKTVLEVKKRSPINSEKIRVVNLKKIKLADEVILGRVGDKYKIIEKERPNVIVLGYDQKNFVDELKTYFPKIKIIRLKSFKPHLYKSSLFRKHI